MGLVAGVDYVLINGIETPAENDERVVAALKEHVRYLYADDQGGSATVIRQRFLATYGGGNHTDWVPGKKVPLHTFIEKTDGTFERRNVDAKVELIFPRDREFIILRTEVDLVSANDEPLHLLCQQKSIFYLLQLSDTAPTKPIAYRQGMFTSLKYDSKYHVVGATRPGEAGGGCFSIDGNFYGISVNCKDVVQKVEDMRTDKFPNRSHIVSPGILLSLLGAKFDQSSDVGNGASVQCPANGDGETPHSSPVVSPVISEKSVGESFGEKFDVCQSHLPPELANEMKQQFDQMLSQYEQKMLAEE